MIDYEDLILQHQELQEIYEDGGDELDFDHILYADDLYDGSVIVDGDILT